jgi:hypothetical protein
LAKRREELVQQQLIGMACDYDPENGFNNVLKASIECVYRWFPEKGKRVAVLSYQESGHDLYQCLRENLPEHDVYSMNIQAMVQFTSRLNGPEQTEFDHSVDLVVLAIPEMLMGDAVRFVKYHLPNSPLIALPFLRGRMPGVINLNIDDKAFVRPKVAVVFPGAGAGRMMPQFAYLMEYLHQRKQYDFTDTNMNLRIIEQRLKTSLSRAALSFKGDLLSQEILDDYFTEQLKVNPRNYSYSYIHDIVSSHVFSRNKHVSCVYLIRDPRDIINSMYHRMVQDSIQEEFQEFMALNKEDALLAIVEGFDYVRKDYVLKWPSLKKMCEDFVHAQEAENIYAVRYEDIRYQPMNTYKSLMGWLELDHFPLYPLHDEIFEEAIKRGTFAAQTQGERSEGEANDKLFRGSNGLLTSVRKGVAGDWKTHFSPKVVKRVKETVSDELIRLGYEESNDW